MDANMDANMDAVDRDLTETIRANLEAIRARMDAAARQGGRTGDAVRLVVVTKAQPVPVIRAALAAGANILGENYPEESVPKMAALGKLPGVAWHMIGHLQSRKAPLIVEHFDMLQSLDSLRLAEKLDRRLAEAGRVLPVLLEMNVGGEASKFGWPAWDEDRWPAMLPEVEALLALPNLQVQGLMTMPPYEEDPASARRYFDRLRRLRDLLAAQFGAERFHALSMGTSADFEAAVQEGATLVRIGQAIVGPRPPK